MAGFITTKEKFLKQKDNEILSEISKEFCGDTPPFSAWKNLISDIKNSSDFKKLPNDIIIGMEFPCFTGGMNIDLLIAFSDNNDKKQVFIIEAKNWNDNYIKTLNFSDNRRRDNCLHPQIQIFRHMMSFKGYSNIGEQYKVIPYVYIKCSPLGISEIKNKNLDSTTLNVKVTNNLNDIMREIAKQAKNYKDEFKKLEIYNDFNNAVYQPSKSIINSIQNLINNEPAFILTDKQQQTLDMVLQAIKSDNKIIQINGPAGSGKTAILVHLYFELSKDVNSKIRPILVTGAYNTDYYRSISKKNSEIFEFSHSLGNIIKQNDGFKYVVLMDEAQHNNKGEINKIIKMGATLVVCFDEYQTIRATNCLDELMMLKHKQNFIDIEMSESMRYNGSTLAEKNIKNFLQSKPIIKDDLFNFEVCNSFSDFQKKLMDIIDNNPNSTVATVGLLCNNSKYYLSKNRHESIFRTKWYEKAECDWMKYVMNKKYLQKQNDKIWIGTWWMQGLDVDYVAVIVGDDATLTDDGISADPHKSALYQTIISIAENMKLPKYLADLEAKTYANNIINYIDNSNDKLLKLEFEVLFSKYVTNYYYIMLTRGRKGCIVYFANNNRNKK